MQSGYFVVGETDAHAAIIFPTRFVGNTPIVELRRWLDRRDITEPLAYVPMQFVTVIPIADIGVG